MLATTASANAAGIALVFGVIVLLVVLLLLSASHRRRQPTVRPRQANPRALLVMGIIFLGISAVLLGSWVVLSLEADGIAKLPLCSGLSTAKTCQTAVSVVPLSRFTTVSSGRGRTTHYWMRATLVVAGRDSGLREAELDSYSCWASLQTVAYPGRVVANKLVSLNMGGVECRTKDHPGVAAAATGLSSLATLPTGLLMLWMRRKALRVQSAAGGLYGYQPH